MTRQIIDLSNMIYLRIFENKPGSVNELLTWKRRRQALLVGAVLFEYLDDLLILSFFRDSK